MSSKTSNFWNGIPARVLLGVFAVLLAVFAWLQYQEIDEINTTRSGMGSPEQLATLETSPAVAECAERRYADIDKMVTDGFLANDAAAGEKADAMSLCIAQSRP